MKWRLEARNSRSTSVEGRLSFSGDCSPLSNILPFHCMPGVCCCSFKLIGGMTNLWITAYERLPGCFRVTSGRQWLRLMSCSIGALFCRQVTRSSTRLELRGAVAPGHGGSPGCHTTEIHRRTTGKNKTPLHPVHHKPELRCTQCSTNFRLIGLRCTQCTTKGCFQAASAAPSAAYLHSHQHHENSGFNLQVGAL